MKTFPTIALGAVAAVALVAAGYAAGRFFAPVTFVAAPTAEIVRTVQAQGGGEDALALSKALSEADALRAEAAALKERLAALQAAPKEEAAPERPRRRSPRERMEELRRTDPERYKAMQARRQEFQTRMAEAAAKRDDFLGSVDLSLLTPEQQETHRRFTEALAAQQEALARIQELEANGGEVSEADRRAVGEAFRAVRELEDAERDALLGAVATSMGLRAGEEADSFVEVVRSIYDSTGTMPAVRMGPPPPGP